MSEFPFFEFFPEQRVDPNATRQIGGETPNRPLTLMRVEDRGGELCFAGETGEVFTRAQYPRAEYRSRDEIHTHEWTRLCYQAPLPRGDIRAGDQLVIALLPFTSEGVLVSTFKHPRRSDRAAVPEPVKATGNDIDALDVIRELERWKYDYVETRRDLLTAGFSAADTAQLDEVKKAAIAKVERGVWLPEPQAAAGVCANFKRFEQRLSDHPRVAQLIRKALTGNIRCHQHDTLKSESPHVPLYEEIRNEAAGYAAIALRQALAGPHEHSEDWVDRPVIDLFQRRFCGLLNDANRRFARRAKRTDHYDDTHHAGDGDDPLSLLMQGEDGWLQSDAGDDHDETGWGEDGEPLGDFWNPDES